MVPADDNDKDDRKPTKVVEVATALSGFRVALQVGEGREGAVGQDDDGEANDEEIFRFCTM